MKLRSSTPDVMPNLSAGAHRSPRRGACFMEFASYLAGEQWSDHPQCTDPVLSALARGVNDGVSDARRDELVHQIPRVIGLRGDDSAIGPIVALRAASEALRVSSMDRQRSLAVGILGLRRVLTTLGVSVPDLERSADEALRDVPDAFAWAQAYIAGAHRATDLHPSATQAITRIAAAGVAQACIDDPDALLIRMLDRAIADVEEQVTHVAAEDRALIPA